MTDNPPPQLSRIEIAPANDITHEIFSVRMPSVEYLNILMLRFRGTYGAGSGGNADAEYMTAIVQAALSYTEPFGLIFDLTDLDYRSGDMMSKVLCSADNYWGDNALPVAIVVSGKCDAAIRSLLTQELLMEDLKLLHLTIDSAIAYIDEMNTARDVEA